MKTTSGWSAKLTRSIVLKDGTRLVTLGDVRAFILKQPEHIQERGSWQHAAELMILAAERGGSIEAATTQIEDALFLEARYVRQWHYGGAARPKRPRSPFSLDALIPSWSSSPRSGGAFLWCEGLAPRGAGCQRRPL